MKLKTIAALRWLTIHLCLSPFYAGLLLVGWQCFQWLATGVWHSFTSIELLLALGLGKESWLTSPDKWVGVWKILNWLPGSVLVAMSSLFTFMLAGEWITWLDRKSQSGESSTEGTDDGRARS